MTSMATYYFCKQLTVYWTLQVCLLLLMLLLLLLPAAAARETQPTAKW
jgi:hypothetical protein